MDADGQAVDTGIEVNADEAGYAEVQLAAGEYADVAKNAWYQPYVKYVTQLGLMNGTGHGVFGPDTPFSTLAISNATLLASLHRLHEVHGEDLVVAAGSAFQRGFQ